MQTCPSARVLRDLRELTDGEPTGGLERGDFEALGVADSGDKYHRGVAARRAPDGGDFGRVERAVRVSSGAKPGVSRERDLSKQRRAR